MDLFWNSIPEAFDITDDMAVAFRDTQLRLQETVTKHRFSTKEKADIFLGGVHGDYQEAHDQGRHLADMFVKWRAYENPITLPELLLLACDFFEIDMSHDLFSPALTACILGEIPHDNPYHDNFHFREVLAVMMRFCAHHNVSRVASHLKLSHDDILLMLIAAAIHDFAHDGLTNFKGGEYVPSRLEKQSIHLARPFLNQAGLSEDYFHLLEMMIVCTDTARNPDGRSPAGIVRDIYLAHEHGTLSMLVVPSCFEPFIQDHKSALMARMLCEADITPSSGINYEFSKQQTIALAKENHAITPSASTLYVFMEVICHGGYDTPAAKALFGSKFREILQAVRNDSVNGVLYS